MKYSKFQIPSPYSQYFIVNYVTVYLLIK